GANAATCCVCSISNVRIGNGPASLSVPVMIAFAMPRLLSYFRQYVLIRNVPNCDPDGVPAGAGKASCTYVRLSSLLTTDSPRTGRNCQSKAVRRTSFFAGSVNPATGAP